MSDKKLWLGDIMTFYCCICVINNIIINHQIHRVNRIIILVKTLIIHIFSFEHL